MFTSGYQELYIVIVPCFCLLSVCIFGGLVIMSNFSYFTALKNGLDWHASQACPASNAQDLVFS
jgi:hypothetical protein